MKTSKIFIFLFLLILILGGAYYFARPYFRLPFDKVKIIDAVEGSAELLVKLPKADLFQIEPDHAYLWSDKGAVLIELLDFLEVGEKDKWDEWWMIPQSGETSDQMAFTFIGSSSEIDNIWSPESYGPSLPFEHGDIFSFKFTTDEQIYFSRYHNLLLVGQYPFLIENALLAVKNKITSWADNEFMPDALTNGDIAVWDCYIRNTNRDRSVLKEMFSYSAMTSEPLSWDWAAFSLNEVDSVAYFKSVLAGVGEMQANISPSSWNYIPPDIAFALPLDGKRLITNTPAGPGITEWLGDGGWTIQLTQPATDIKVNPRIWIMPISDSLTYQKFKRVNKEKLTAIDRRTYQLFALEQWQNAGPFDKLSDRKLWQPWVCELGDILLLSVYREDLEKYLDYHLLGASLVDSEIFLQLQQRFEPIAKGEWQAYQYWQSPQDKLNILELLSPYSEWANHGVLLAQAKTVSDQAVIIEGVIQSSPKRTGTSIDWSLAIPSREKVKLLKVDDANGEAIAGLIQNSTGQIWAYDDKGNELWQQYVSEELYEAISIIDYSNGIQRWVGTTPSDVYLWDNNGIDQANHLLKGLLPTSSPALMNFPSIDQTLIAFSTREGTLELRYLNGKSPDNWPLDIEDEVEEPLLYIGQEREDLIVAQTVTDSWVVANSLGEILRVIPAGDSVRTARAGRGAVGYSTNTSEADQLVKVYIDGTLNINALSATQSYPLEYLGRGPVDHALLINCWGDKRLDYIIQRGSLVHLFAYSEDQLSERWQYRFPVPPDRIIAAPPYGILALSNQRKQVWLLNDQGELLDGFPVGGEDNAFLIGNKEGEYRLMTLLDGKLYAYYLLD